MEEVAQDHEHSGTPSMKSFEYEPLSTSRHFRLLTLVNEQQRSNIKALDVELIEVSQDDHPPYEFLSYVESSAAHQFGHCVSCAGHTINVPEVDFQALQALKNTGREQPIWMASICINQKDTLEKVSQIALMQVIMQQAARTNIWLGVESGGPVQASNLLYTMVAARQSYLCDVELPQIRQVSSTKNLASYRSSFPSQYSLAWTDLNELLNMPNFMRASAVPDYVISRSLVIMLGSLEIQWADFIFGLEGYACYAFPNLIKSSSLEIVLNIDKLRTHFHEGQSCSLDQILEALRPLKATDPHDKLYVVLLLLKRTSFSIQNWLSPIYNLTYASVLRNLAITLFGEGLPVPFLTGLSMVEHRDDLTEHGALPTWVPDWTIPMQTYRLNTAGTDFRASGQTDGHLRFVGHPILHIALKGNIVGTIVRVATYNPPRRFCDKYNVSGANAYFFLEWFEWAVSQSSGPDRELLLLQYAKTIQGGFCTSPLFQEDLDHGMILYWTKSFLNFLEDEEVTETEQIRSFYAGCLPSHGRRFGITSAQNFCLVPRGTRPSDLVCIPFGSKVPYILRKAGEEYLNVGECYVHGIMQGEALALPGCVETEFIIR